MSDCRAKQGTNSECVARIKFLGACIAANCLDEIGRRVNAPAGIRGVRTIWTGRFQHHGGRLYGLIVSVWVVRPTILCPQSWGVSVSGSQHDRSEQHQNARQFFSVTEGEYLDE